LIFCHPRALEIDSAERARDDTTFYCRIVIKSGLRILKVDFSDHPNKATIFEDAALLKYRERCKDL